KDQWPGSQSVQQRSRQLTPGTVARVKDHLEARAPNRRDVHNLQDASQVAGIGVVEPMRLAQCVPVRPAEIAALPPIEQDAALGSAQDHATSLEEFEPVVL